MKLIQLGGANDALCHFLSFGGYEMLLECGVSLLVGDAAAPSPLRVRLPALSAVDVASLDVVLLSNHLSLLALPFLTERLGFHGTVYATEMTVRFGRVLLAELSNAATADGNSIAFELPPTAASPAAPSESLASFSLDEIARCLDRVIVVEYKEVTRLSYGVALTALSSGFSLGASVWLLESPSDRVAYVAAASGDLNRHPKELDFAPLIDCDTLIVTDIKPDRDPKATTELTVERLLTAVSRVVDRGGVCVLPCSLGGVVFDLIEAVHAACIHTKKTPPLPMVLLSPLAEEALDLAQCGAEFLCEKKVGKLYAAEAAFAHEQLRKSKALLVASELNSQVLSALQHGGVVFVSHPTLRLGLAGDVVRHFGRESRHAVVLTDAAFDHTVLAPFFSLAIEKMVCPIDARLSCGDVNQFIARCCPRNLIVPHEYLVEASVSSASSSSGVKSETLEASHFSRVFPLHELIAARPKTELETFPMKPLEPVSLDKSNKYIEGKLDPGLAVRAVMTDVNGKGVACISGRISVKHHEFIVEPSERPSDIVSRGFSAAKLQQQQPTAKSDSKARLAGTKRKAASTPAMAGPTLSPSGAAIQAAIEYREKSSMLLGQVDEERLLQDIKKHDSSLDVYISQGPNNADAMLSIPSLDARVTLWKESAKTLVETPKEEARALLQRLVLAQLHELPM